MKLLFSKTVSFILNPFFVALIGAFVLVFRTSGDFLYSLKWALFSLIYAVICILFIFFGVLKGFFSDLDISNRRERVILYPFLLGVTVIFLLSIRFFGGPQILYYAVGGVIAVLLAGSFVNVYVKASGHVGTITAFVIPFVLRYGDLFYFMLLLIPLVAWARIALRKHTLFETIVGGLIGGVISIIVYFIVQYQM